MSILDSILGHSTATTMPYAQQVATPVPMQVASPQLVPSSYFGSRQNDGYQSFGGSLVRNTLTGAGLGAAAGLVIPGVGVPIGAAAGAAVGAGSALIRQPRVAAALGDGMKAGLAGAAGGALVGSVTPINPIVGAAAGAGGGFLVGTLNGLLKNVDGGRYSIEARPTVGGKVMQGAKLGGLSGAALGAGVGAIFGGIGAVPGGLIGAAIGAIGGGLYGLMSGTTDAATGAKGAMLFAPSTSSVPVQQYPPQMVQQVPCYGYYQRTA